MSEHNSSIREELQSHGLRATAGRHAVLDWLSRHPHTTADEVHQGVLARIGSFSKQAVYDVLSACVDAHMARRIELPGHPARYERRTGDNHHHLVCRACARIVDVDCDAGHAPCLSPSDEQGFAVDEAEVVFWGLCERCKAEECAADGSPAGQAET